MKERLSGANPATRGRPTGRGPGFWIGLAVVGAGLVLTGLALVLGRLGGSSTSESAPEQPSTAAAASAPDAVEEADTHAKPVRPRTTVPPPASPTRIPSATVTTPTADSRLLVNDIWSVDSAAGPMTRERAAQWKRSYDQLVQSGVAAVPAIAELLSTNQNKFFSAPESAVIGYGSVREALFDALEKIGGSEARDVLLATLRQTGDAAEIRSLGSHLEQMAPGEYRADILAAARETLDLTRKGQLPGGDIGPIFDVLRKYGDSSVVAELQASRQQWSHYASIALAGLPNGEGIPSLLETVRTETQQKPTYYLVSFQLLAQVAAQQSSAASGLLDLARENKIPAAAWPLIAQGLLATDAYQFGQPTTTRLSGYSTAKVEGGKQQYYTPPLLADQYGDLIQARLGFVDEMLGVTSDPTAIAALKDAQAKLAAKAGRP